MMMRPEFSYRNLEVRGRFWPDKRVSRVGALSSHTSRRCFAAAFGPRNCFACTNHDESKFLEVRGVLLYDII